ncbi:Transcriptional regulator [Pararobbsia alpina]|uniref:TetR/AcrR family transcriptional regulator n=1 Tax=Pararobbsia alpina TaxID=621374 RepID=UPI0039A43146
MIARMDTLDTKGRILAVARRMVQAHGYNALSIREVATEVGIKGPAVHHHYPTKGDLGAALARQYSDDAQTYLDGLLERQKSERTQFDDYIKIFRAALENDNRMCLSGILAAEHHDLPDAVKVEVERFMDINVEWLTRLLSLDAERKDKKANKARAMAIFAAVEGAQLIARGRADIRIFDETLRAYRTNGLIP